MLGSDLLCLVFIQDVDLYPRQTSFHLVYIVNCFVECSAVKEQVSGLHFSCLSNSNPFVLTYSKQSLYVTQLESHQDRRSLFSIDSAIACKSIVGRDFDVPSIASCFSAAQLTSL